MCVNPIEELITNIQNFKAYHNATLPLCAAENRLSDFCKIPLAADFQERYIMGNFDSYDVENNFIGSEYLLPFYKMMHQQCEKLYNAKYSDARTLSGMNCATTTLMALTSIGDKIALLPSAWGGHPSMKIVSERLGLHTVELPYNLETYDLDYNRANELLRSEKIPFILLAPSDIIKPFDISKFDLTNTLLIYDVSQLMGLIAAGRIENPLNHSNNILLIGGTHKTLPGPTCGLTLTNNNAIHSRLNEQVNPLFIRNIQIHQVISLLFTLIEFEYYGKDYADTIVSTSNSIGQALTEFGFQVARLNERYSDTHQIFVETSVPMAQRIYHNATKYGVTLNRKSKLLFRGDGIRIGTQEIARFQWNDEAVHVVCEIFHQISLEQVDELKLKALFDTLPPKHTQFTLPEDITQKFYELLQ